jgi:hypothetical protein
VELALVHLGASVGVVAEHDGKVVGGHDNLRQPELPILSSARLILGIQDQDKTTFPDESDTERVYTERES